MSVCLSRSPCLATTRLALFKREWQALIWIWPSSPSYLCRCCMPSRETDKKKKKRSVRPPIGTHRKLKGGPEPHSAKSLWLKFPMRESFKTLLCLVSAFFFLFFFFEHMALSLFLRSAARSLQPSLKGRRCDSTGFSSTALQQEWLGEVIVWLMRCTSRLQWEQIQFQSQVKMFDKLFQHSALWIVSTTSHQTLGYSPNRRHLSWTLDILSAYICKVPIQGEVCWDALY